MEKVSANAGILDLLQSAGRSILLLIGAVPILLKLVGAHDVFAIVAYFKSSDGAAVLAAVGALFAIAHGLYKAHKRGKQVVEAVPYTPKLELK